MHWVRNSRLTPTVMTIDVPRKAIPLGLGLSDEQLNDYEEMDNDIMVSIGISPEEPTSKARTPKKRISFSVTIDGDFSDSIILKVQGNGQIKKEYV